MASKIKSKDHNYLLVEYVENSRTYYRIARSCDLVSCSRFSLDQRLHFQFEDDLTKICNVIITSNDVDYLNDELANILEDCENLNNNNNNNNNKMKQFKSCDALNTSIRDETQFKSGLSMINLKKPRAPKTVSNNLFKSLDELKNSMSRLTQLDENAHPNKPFVFGPNGTEISARCFSRVTWSCHKSATRTLLKACFSDQMLANHCSPGRKDAMRQKPQLNARKLEDIIAVVTERCYASKADVLEVISNLCRYEHTKMKRHLESSPFKFSL
ncbi:PREDICTED: uncharacterized protein LOC108564827 [Nicrophorus vespilloides]|uniref:Uncharacterized protein LOC108564827 n=1 Tax=Nicrophorus vespilloides TaxID=110193 RepID=A0ABM1MY21_NICVS|nr:PREDICTED: uncharacterized protein LOC108564827 [Nicrophorus vespilloides]